MIVWISGPTGAGKSSFANLFCALGFVVIQEKLPEERFRDFATNPIQNCARLQEMIMRSRFERWQELSDSPRIVFDRSIDEDVSIFCRMHHELGFLDEQHYEKLRDIAFELQRQMPNPDLTIFMCPERRVLTERVTESTHPSLIVQSLNRQLLLYSEWLATRPEDILRLDNSACRLRIVQQLFSGSPLC
jgi:deoxyadenosine/deoxycytidine kinase